MSGLFKAMAYIILPLIGVGMACVSCSEEDNTVDEWADWQKKNDSYWNSLYSETQQRISSGDNSWRVLTVWSKDEKYELKTTDRIIVHVLNEGKGTEQPLYTDTVRVHYVGWLIPSASYAGGYQFDKSYSDDSFDTETSIPAKGALSGFTDGFATALLNMHQGDHWRIYVPYTLGYGANVHGSIPAYSTLIFEVTLASFWHPGTRVPEWSAKPAPFFGD